ncbi:hypothetical protein JTE90_010644 [Oedothorax gibbosus]|uniref:Uncharacterized protein n=1 Tax=Oedothorax gibbosus TaxID=931172 RepID=A0AAV6UBA0_9ARAC|nr:hypothetical protein JTE90_010644 [Oedothorax gibbosus]
MASIVRRVRKFFGNVWAFVNNEDLKEEVIPSYDDMNDLHFWEDIVGKRQVQFNGYHVFNGSVADLSLCVDPQRKTLVETTPNGNLHKCSPNDDTAGDKTASNEENSNDETEKIETFREILDWSIVDGMGDTFSRPQVKKQNAADEKKGSLVRRCSKRRNVAMMTILEKESQEMLLNLDNSIISPYNEELDAKDKKVVLKAADDKYLPMEPSELVKELMDDIIENVHNNVEQALSIDAETSRSKLDKFLHDSDECFALHYRECLRSIEFMRNLLEQI